jgi:tRNA threonylcarbamoyladenosine biosynthesis protein TsaB
MGLILSIETAISVCSVALHREGKLVGCLELHQDNVHAQKLMPAIKALLDRAGIETAELDAIAVSAGPGSYTGLRIGVSTAKGLAYAHDLPLIAVDTLSALAYRASEAVEPEDFLIPVIDARRMEVYQKVLNGRMEEISPLEPLIIDEQSFSEYLQKGKVFFIGDAVFKIKSELRHENARFLSLLNSAISIGELAYEKFEKGDFVDLAYFEPNYLKEFRVITSKKNPLLL